jgi:hypothetical protein
MINKNVLYEMFNIYGYPNIDWMGYEVTDDDIITYHHIKEKRNGGPESVNNGALLTSRAHLTLHRIEKYDIDLYNEYNYYFQIINDMKCPPTFELMEIMECLKERSDYILKHKKLYNQINAAKKVLVCSKFV